MENKYSQLVSVIEKIIEELSLELENSNNKRVDYLDNFFESYSIKNPITFFNITTSDLLLAFLLEADRETDFDILSSRVDDVREYLDNIKNQELDDIIDHYVKNEKNMEKMNKLHDNAVALWNKYSNTDFAFNKAITMFLDETTKLFTRNTNFKFKSYEDILTFIKLVKLLHDVNKNGNLSIIALSVYLHSKSKKIKIISADKHTAQFADDVKDLLERMLTDLIDRKLLEQEMEFLYSYYEQMEKELKSANKTRNKKIYRYVELKKILEEVKGKEEITNIDNIVEKILDDDIKRLCLEYIYEHNMKYYSDLYQEYSYKSKNSINKYISFFETLSINFMEIPKEIQTQIMSVSLDEIKKKLKLLPKITIDNSTKIDIIYKTQISVIEEINLLLKKGYIDLELLSNNLDIYYDETKFKNLKNNIELLREENINIRELSSKSILLVDYDLIKENIKLLKDMNISIKGINNIDMLSKTDLPNYIASLIEVNLEDILKLHPELLNSDNNLAKRIIIAKTIGEDIYENGTLKDSIIDKNRFFVSDSEINNYLFDRDNSKYHSNFIIELENSTDSSFSYDMEGVKIPKSRVSNLNISLDNIIKPSLYSKEEIKILEKHSK